MTIDEVPPPPASIRSIDGVRRPLPDHGLAIVEPLDLFPRGDRFDEIGKGAHRKGTRDGLIEVSCYCGRRVYRMTPDEVLDGKAPPACTALACRREESER